MTDYSLEDDWAGGFFQRLLEERLPQRDFESAVKEHWESGRIVVAAPRTADYIEALVKSLDAKSEVRYASGDPSLKFRSYRLAGKPEIPGAIYISAPAEKKSEPSLSELNRPLHAHDSGRINLVTSGDAVFYFQTHDEAGVAVIVECPVSEGDLIFWPAWTPHTFNALDGFSVVSSMASFVSPEEDGYTVMLSERDRVMDAAPRVMLSDFVTARCGLQRLRSTG